MLRVAARVLAVTLLVAGGVLAFTPVTATAAEPPCQFFRGPVCFIYPPPPPPPGGGAGPWTTQCFGREGSFRAGTSVVKVDWESNRQYDECFGIAPDRQIYHAWRSSAGWDPMPNNGRADKAEIPFLYQNQYHTISVYVYGKGGYCSTLTKFWLAWVPCTAP